jgi:hypothetical protein
MVVEQVTPNIYDFKLGEVPEVKCRKEVKIKGKTPLTLITDSSRDR